MYTSFDARLVTSVGLNGVWAAVGQWYLGSGWMHNSRGCVQLWCCKLSADDVVWTDLLKLRCSPH